MRLHVLVFIVLSIVLHSGCDNTNNNGLLTIEQTNGTVVNDIGLASFPTPEGWMPNRSDGNTAVILIRLEANRQAPDEMISIDIGTPVSQDVKGSADGIASKFTGTVSLLPDDIGGEQAYRVSIPANYDQMMPRECIVVHHGGKVCFLFGGSKSKADIWPVLSEIAESWEWK